MVKFASKKQKSTLEKGALDPLGSVLLSQDLAVQVPSALEGLTAVFGMGTRGSPPPSPPNGIDLVHRYRARSSLEACAEGDASSS